VNFPLAATIVDLDPQQQMVSELWAMCVQIGGNAAYLRGDYTPGPFTNLWLQAQGDEAPNPPISLAATYQSSLTNITSQGLTSGSKFLKYFDDNPATSLSINFTVNSHNSSPKTFDFTKNTGWPKLQAANIPADVLTLIEPLQLMQQNFGVPKQPQGQLPTKDFVTHILQQFLSLEQYNANIDAILEATEIPYEQPSRCTTPYPTGKVTGTVGTGTGITPGIFVPSRRMYSIGGYNFGTQVVNDAFFTTYNDGKSVALSLANSLPLETCAGPAMSSKLGELWLVSFPEGTSPTSTNVTKLAKIPYTDAGFITTGGGFFTYTGSTDLSQTPLGILSVMSATEENMILQENNEGYYLRADQFVFRMNPGVTSTPQEPRGETATLNIYALKYGQPVEDDTKVSFKQFIPPNYDYPAPLTLGKPTSALTDSGTAGTVNGVASFVLTASDPNNPRDFMDGQLYFLTYTIDGQSNDKGELFNPKWDFVSIQVYDKVTNASALEVLNKFGRLYKIMGFLTDKDTVEEMGMRNMIKLMVERPWDHVQHMPVSRDMSLSAQNTVTEWINSLNNA